MTIRTRGTLPVCAATVVVTLAGASLSIQHSYGAQAVAVDRGSRDYTLPDQMQWRDTEDGTTSNLYGDPSKPGLYAYILKRGPNVWSKPHFHDNDRFVTVLEGTLWVGTGKFDPQRTVPLKAGSFVRDVAGGIHFEGTKDDGATLYFVGNRAVAKPSGGGRARPPPPIGSRRDRSGDQAGSADRGHAEGIVRPVWRLEQARPLRSVPETAPNNWSRPHYHPIDRVVMVLGGTMWIGTDRAATGPERSRCRKADSSAISRRVFTTMDPGTIRCGFRLPASGRRRRPMSTHRSSLERQVPGGRQRRLGRRISYAAMADAVRAGYASASTDTGHVGGRGTFALGHPEKLIDFAWRSEHEMTVKAKAVIQAFYGSAPRCPTGTAARPAGDRGSRKRRCSRRTTTASSPARRPTALDALWIRCHAVLKDPASYIPPAKYPVIHQAALNACDARDGLKDGLIDDPSSARSIRRCCCARARTARPA